MRFSAIITSFIVAAICSVTARFFQLFSDTDLKTGFFLAGKEKSARSLLFLIIAVIIIACIMSVFTRRSPKKAPVVNLSIKITALFLSVSLFVEALFCTYSSRSELLIVATKLFALLSAIVLIFYVFLRDESEKTKYCLPLVFLPLYFLFKLIVTFTAYASVSIIASNIFLLLFLCSALACSLMFSKIECNINMYRTTFWFFPLSIASSILALCCSLPSLGMLLAGRISFDNFDIFTVLLGISYSAFTVAYLLALYSRKNLFSRKSQKKQPITPDNNIVINKDAE